MFTRALARLLVAAMLLGCAAPALAQHGAAASHEPAAGAEQSAEHAEEVDLNPLSWSTDLALWTGVIFVVLLIVLGKFAWGPIVDGLDKRERTIADQIASAEQTNADARQLLAQYHQKLAQSEDEVRRMLDEAKRDAQKVGHEIVEMARDEAQAEHRRALAEIELATAGALKELAERSATLAVDLAGKIVETRLDPAAHAKLIEQAVDRFSHAQPGNN